MNLSSGVQYKTTGNKIRRKEVLKGGRGDFTENLALPVPRNVFQVRTEYFLLASTAFGWRNA